ncbi:MAG: class I SAM-dependent methyltransferase [Pirellulales bacterium]|nr:class I SAM-dependent methyltransferase [Pirellulales bacterium]
MNLAYRTLLPLIAALCLLLPVAELRADSGQSTRIDETQQQDSAAKKRPPYLVYRDKSDYILRELDLRPGDVVVDIGAGDGWWAAKMARRVGVEGTVHAAEVSQTQVDRMKKKYAKLTQLKPYLCPKDGTGLGENTCDLAFISKTYHHLPQDKLVDYLRRLRRVIKPTGRVVIVEAYADLASGRWKEHAFSPGRLALQAEEAGWTLVRCEMVTGSRHFMAIFARPENFIEKKTDEKSKKQPQGRSET